MDLSQIQNNNIHVYLRIKNTGQPGMPAWGRRNQPACEFLAGGWGSKGDCHPPILPSPLGRVPSGPFSPHGSQREAVGQVGVVGQQRGEQVSGTGVHGHALPEEPFSESAERTPCRGILSSAPPARAHHPPPGLLTPQALRRGWAGPQVERLG